MERHNTTTDNLTSTPDTAHFAAGQSFREMCIYKTENLSFTYPNRDRPALNRVDFTIARGEFVTLCGPSGCGKTTLLRHLKPSAMPHGERSGEIFFCSGDEGSSVAPLRELSASDAASKIGFVMQSPDNQIVTDKVWHELAFGLESLGMKTPEIRLRVAEMASFFGIQTWFHKSVTELSGGQKQMLALASIMALQPSALILDEPTSQLDPIAAGEFLATVAKINRELGVTVILTEHRLEEALPISSRALVMDAGRLVADGLPREVGLLLREQGSGMFLAMPTAMRVWHATQTTRKIEIGNSQPAVPIMNAISNSISDDSSMCPITIREGANWLLGQKGLIQNREELQSNVDAKSAENSASSSYFESTGSEAFSSPAVVMDDVWFRYEKSLPDVLTGLSMTAGYGEFTAILGGNGTGKTTALSIITGLNKPYRGRVKVDSAVYALPQNPQSLFVGKTVRDDLLEILSERKLPDEARKQRFSAMVKLCRLSDLLDSHPYDLSGGEQQRAALAKVLLLQPRILLLDEPTKGLDAEFKQVFAAILRKLTDSGVAVVMVSHDIEFCAEYADRCALFFDGNIVTENSPRAFFSGNSFYTTSANRMARSVLPNAITANDIILSMGCAVPPAPEIEGVDADSCNDSVDLHVAQKRPKLSVLRKTLASAFALLLVAVIAFAAVNFAGFRAFISGGNEAIVAAGDSAWTYISIMLALAAGIIGLTLSLSFNREMNINLNAAISKTSLLGSSRRPSRRAVTAAFMILLAIPITIFAGTYFFGDRRFYFISLLVVLETMLPFALVFESRKPQARELVVIAVLCAIAVAGRAAFFMLPQFKPVIALVIITGVAFGGEAGFMVGAMTGFVSNFFLGQGPWTPYQMFAFGIIGFLSGVLFRKGLLNRSRGSLAVFGAFATLIIYGGIMNPASMVIWQSGSAMTGKMLLFMYLQGLPMDLVHAAATVTYILIIARPMLEKLDRIKVKYGLVE